MRAYVWVSSHVHRLCDAPCAFLSTLLSAIDAAGRWSGRTGGGRRTSSIRFASQFLLKSLKTNSPAPVKTSAASCSKVHSVAVVLTLMESTVANAVVFILSVNSMKPWAPKTVCPLLDSMKRNSAVIVVPTLPSETKSARTYTYCRCVSGQAFGAGTSTRL